MPPETLYWLSPPNDLVAALQALKKAADAPEAQLERITELAQRRMDFVQTAKLDRVLEATLAALPSRPPTFKLAWLSTSTVDHLLPSTRIACLRRGVHLDSYVAPYGQYRQELLDPGSALAAFAPNAVLIALDPTTALAEIGIAASGEQVRALIVARVAELRGLWQRARALGATVIHQSVPNLALSVFGAFDAQVPAAPRRLIDRFNAAVADAATQDGVLLLDLASATTELGQRAWCDEVRWHQAKQLVAPAMAPMYGDLAARIIGALRGRSRKCLVLDLDNTVWGGVIGDDGIEGIVLGQGSAAGEAYVAFQRYAKLLSTRGIVLAVCSKNTLSVAESAFSKHPDMVLKREDISVFTANWQDKATNIRAIAKTLDIGLDSLVFFDDNPVERALVRRELPEIAVPEVPEEPALYARCLADAGYFESVGFTDDDLKRAQQYADNARRQESIAGATDTEGFLRSLAMEMQFGAFDAVNLPRIAQLVNKSNQWNLTTRRYTATELEALGNAPHTLSFYFRLLDSFGDNGLISVLVARPYEGALDRLLIDTWLMSCRVLGRGVEDEVLNLLIEAARRAGVREILGEYLPTEKNQMVHDLLPHLGFSLDATDHAGPGSARYRLIVAAHRERPTHIRSKDVSAP